MTRIVLVIISTIIIFGAAQGELAHKLSIGEISPDFLIVAVVAIGLLLGPIAGILAGALAGLTHASVVGMGMGTFLLSRAIVGYFAGLTKSHVFQDNPIVPFIGGVVGTLVAESVFVLFSPPVRLAAWIAPLPLIAIYNGILTIFILRALRKLLASPIRRRRTRPFQQGAEANH